MSANLKRDAAEAALSELRPGMRIGLGTGSTAREFVDLLGAMVAKGFQCQCVVTSEATGSQAAALNIPLISLDDGQSLDITVDGADEIDPELNLIKGAGGALLREKIVASASKRMVVIADGRKLVPVLGAFALPIEVDTFGLGATMAAVKRVMGVHGASGDLVRRESSSGVPALSDGGNVILDAFFGRISNAKALSDALLNIPGVFEHGLFLGMCTKAYVADADGVRRLERQETGNVN